MLTIREEVLKEHFGTKDLRWVDGCPPDEISKEDIYAVIDIAIKKTLEEVYKIIHKPPKETKVLTLNNEEVIGLILKKDWERVNKTWK